MTRTARRAAQLAALSITDTRGARFARASAAVKGPDFADMAAVPRWMLLSDAQQHRVAQAVGVIRHHAAIMRELSGPRLSLLAAAVGEDLLDAVCAGTPLDDGADHALLPRPDQIVGEGWDVMQRGLPTLLAERFANAQGDAQAHNTAERAVDMVLGL